jgi:TolA-binding protein
MDNKDLIIETMTKQNADLTALVQTLTKSNADLTETIKELQETIRELQRQMNQNSQNSSNRLPATASTSRNRRACAKNQAKSKAVRRDIREPICQSRMNRMSTANTCLKSALPAHT